ncbi:MULTISPECIES: permease prefix domain 1-containing protein [Deinococcus]|jgi:hypothetical protein|nr:permease prefix domain 1-containing protein [Deinococcus radiodurans]ANC70851.1 hypothetical protein A2G07_03205 [Deinococcus radiodurans R1 = ATCC 13939 = DSM 20539]QIP27792.1 hypothetical protein HAV23_00045 [Deinococcus radiodurans]QIP31326.1 hypothetical protein HAV35_03470 [Deinococcus radiodurans]UID71046.1 hypothetical protein DRO_2053 [Deinococcus radiodurans R1 = ATCC 13939 = DSM 20539]
MTPEDRFVKAATRGLSRGKRAEAQAELRSHLHERTQQLILAGKPLPSAQAQAMQELGAPAQIARGLRRTEHVHPLLSAAVLLALAGVLLWPVPELRWQQLMSQVYNGVGTSSGSGAELMELGSLPLPEARRRLGTLDIELVHQKGSYLLRRAGLPDAPLGDTRTFQCLPPLLPGGTRPTLTDLLNSELPTYVDMPGLLSCMAQAHWPLTVSPSGVALGEQTLPLSWGTDYSLSAALSQVYFPALSTALRQLPAPMWQAAGIGGPLITPLASDDLHSAPPLQLNLPGGTPILALVKKQSRSYGAPERTTYPAFAAALRWTDAQGQLQLPRPLHGPELRLYSSRAAWLQAPLTENATLLLPVSTQATQEISLTPLAVSGPVPE